MTTETEKPNLGTVRGDGFRDCMHAIDGAMALGCQNAHKPPEGHWLTPYWEIGHQLEVEKFATQRMATALAHIALTVDPEFDATLPNEFDRLLELVRVNTLELELYRSKAHDPQ